MAGKKSASGGASGSTGRKKQATAETEEGPATDPFEGQTFRDIDFMDAYPYLENLYDEQGGTDEERNAIAVYKGNEYIYINQALRDPAKWEEVKARLKKVTISSISETPDRVENAITVMAKTKGINLKENIVLHRGFSLEPKDPLREFFMENYKNGTLNGQSFSDKGIASTTVNKNKTFPGNVQVRINALKGTNVLIPNPDGDNGSEQEIMLRPGSKFRIRSSSMNGDTFVLNVDLMPQG